MESIESLLAELQHDTDLNVIRCAICDLITHQLERSRERNNLAALSHLTNAVGSLTLNVNSTRQPIKAGLETCLVDLQKATEAIDTNERRFNLRVKRAEQITYDMLIEAVRSIREKASCDASGGQQAA